MSSVSGIRLPGLATGMDTDTMIKEMLTGEQSKVDKAKQKEQTIKWQQETYREIIKDIKGFNDKYFSLSSKNSIISSSAWSTLTVKSSNENVITATGGAGANSVDYKFEVEKLAQSAKASSNIAQKINADGTTTSVEIKKDSKLSDLGLSSDATFTIRYGSKDDEVSKPITILAKDVYVKGDVSKGDTIDADGNKLDENGKTIVETPADTIDSLMKKINNATDGEVKASYSEMTKSFSLESSKTGSGSGFSILESDGKTESSALNFLGLKGKDKDGNVITKDFVGSKSEIKVTPRGGTEIILQEDTNSFTIDGIKYDVHSIGTSEIMSKQDTKPVVDNMKAFVEDYNKMVDKMYDIVTQKTNRDYPPLTEAQKKDMSEDEIEKWEKKAKEGLLRNDSEMRRFMDDMQKSIFGNKMEVLNEMGLTSHEDYNKKGQIALDEEKFIKALENDSNKVYEIFAKDSSSVMESMKSTINKYVGGSSSIFAKKAGLEKTASVANNFYSEQLKKQEESIKKLQRKMSERESQLYKQFANLESSMNKLNSQMSYFMQA